MHSSSQCCPHQCTYHLFGLGDLKDVADVDSGVDWNWPWPWQIVHPRAVALKYILFVCFFVSSRTPQTWRTFDVRIQSLQLRDREQEHRTPAWLLSNWLISNWFPMLQSHVFVNIFQLHFYPNQALVTRAARGVQSWQSAFVRTNRIYEDQEVSQGVLTCENYIFFPIRFLQQVKFTFAHNRMPLAKLSFEQNLAVGRWPTCPHLNLRCTNILVHMEEN